MKLLLSLATIFLLSSLPGAVSQSIDPVCDTADFGSTPPDPPLPELPQQFSALIEANLGHLMRTFVVREYFDEIGNRGRLEIARPTDNDTFEAVGIFDYDDGEIFLIPDRFAGEMSECGVRLIAEPTTFLNRTFGFELVNGSVHIGSVLSFFLLADGANPIYLGPEIVRGIPCDHWQTCHVLVNNSYTLDYYFSAEEWIDAYRDGPVPVQIRLNGSRLEGDSILHINHTYNFVAFNSGPDSVPDEVFMVPTGLACQGRIPGIPLPVLPPYFSMFVESVSPDMQTVEFFQEFYDMDHNLFRIDFNYDGEFGGPPGPRSLIHDFDLEVQYFINRQLSDCYIIPLTANNSFFDATVDDDGMPQLQSPNELFFQSNEFNFSYEGVSNVRGVDVDSWVSVRDFQELNFNSNLTNGLYEVFFTRPEWNISTLNGYNEGPIPWRLLIRGMLAVNGSANSTNFTGVYDLYGFSEQEPDFDIFDTSVCYSPSEYHILTLAVPGNESGVDLSQFRRNVRLSVAEFAGIPPLQVGNIQVLGENGTHIFVTLHIQNLTDVASIDDRKTANEILSLILLGLGPDGQLPFSFEIQPGFLVSPFFFNVTDGCDNPASGGDICPNVTTPTPCDCSTVVPMATPTTCPTPTPCDPCDCSSNIPMATPVTCPTVTTPSCDPCNCSVSVPMATPVACPTTALPTCSPCVCSTSIPMATAVTCPPVTCDPCDCTTTVTIPMATPANPGTDQTPSASCSGLTNGQTAGVAIGLFVLGLVLGLLLSLVFGCVAKACRSGNYSIKRSVAYQKHDDDIALEG